MKTVYTFDVDGTLTEPRQAADPAFARFFADFASRNIVYLISGSDITKIREQLPQQIIETCTGVFTCAGAVLMQGDKTIYAKHHEFEANLVEAAKQFVDTSPYSKRFGCHLEFRAGLLNISVVGRNASSAERKAYHAWDCHNQERLEFSRAVNSSFEGYEASTGGEISIDIVPVGWNKSVAATEILARHPDHAIHFFGDRMSRDGNDWPLAQALQALGAPHKATSVQSYTDTWDHLAKVTDLAKAA